MQSLRADLVYETPSYLTPGASFPPTPGAPFPPMLGAPLSHTLGAPFLPIFGAPFLSVCFFFLIYAYAIFSVFTPSAVSTYILQFFPTLSPVLHYRISSPDTDPLNPLMHPKFPALAPKITTPTLTSSVFKYYPYPQLQIWCLMLTSILQNRKLSGPKIEFWYPLYLHPAPFPC